MSSLRIVVSHLTPFPSARAPAIQVANMAQAFAEHGHDVLLVNPNPGPAAGEDLSALLGFAPRFRAATLARRTRRGQSLRNALLIDRLVRQEHADLVHSRDLRGSVLPALHGVPTVFEAHALATLRSPVDRWLLRRLVRARGFRGIVAISRALADDLADELGVDPADITVLHDAVRADPTDAAQSPAEDPSTGRRPRIAYTGSLYPGKGADLLLDIARLRPGVDVVVTGGPEARAEELRQLAAAAGLTNLLLPGLVSPAEARRLQRTSDVLVAPFSARVESDSGADIARWTSPLKLFEYMASGTPMVVGDLPVLREVVRPDSDALVVPLDDADAFAAAIDRLLTDRDLADRLADSARRRVLAEHTWGRRAEAVLTLADGRHATGRMEGRSRRVTVVLASFAAGGAERVGLTLAGGLADAGHAVEVVVIDGRGALAAAVREGVHVTDLHAARVRWALPRLVRHLRRRPPDVLVMTQTHVSLALLAAARLLRGRRGARRPTVVVREPLLRTGGTASARLERRQRRLLPSADLLVASSAAMATFLRGLVGPRPPVVELANPVDVPALRAAAARGPARAEATADVRAPGRREAVVVARLVPQKGHADLLRALAAADAADLRLTLVGDGPLRTDLERLAAELNIEGRVQFAGRVDDRDVLLGLVAAADVFVLPSTAEGMPNAVLEALAVGTPVLATTDLTVLADLAAEVGPDALRLVPRGRLTDALTTAAATEPDPAPRPRPSLLPDRFAVDAVVTALLDTLDGRVASGS